MIKINRVPTLLWLTFFVAFSGYAQQEQNTLGALWPEVAKDYPGISVKDAAVEAATYNERAVKSDALPQAKLQAQNSYGTFEGIGGAFFPQPGLFNVNGNGTGATGASTTANFYASGMLEWEFFAFGKQHKKNRAASLQTEKSRVDKESYVLELKKELASRYINLLYNNAQFAWSDKNAERLNDVRKMTQGLAKSGLRPAADSLLALSSYTQAKAEMDHWQGGKEAAFEKLSELYGSEDFDYAASAKRFKKVKEEISEVQTSIADAHPFLESLTQEAEINRLKGDAVQKAALPSLRVLGGYSYRGAGIQEDGFVSDKWSDGFSNTVDNYLVGVGVTWNLTKLFSNKLQKESYYRQAEAAQSQHSQYERQMKADLAASNQKIKQQRKQLQKTALAVEHSQAAFQMYMARYKSGIITLSELLQIRLLLEEAENKHIKAAREYWLQRAEQAELKMDFDYIFNNL